MCQENSVHSSTFNSTSDQLRVPAICVADRALLWREETEEKARDDMSATARRSEPGFERRGVDKFAERRAELAEAALQTLAELGYARTSLREIAQNSEFSHGVLHYYFRDKADLITCCVRHYKDRCIAQYDQVTANAASYDELVEGFIASLSSSIRQDAHLHRLWYDMKFQALFEPDYQSDVGELDESLEDMVWRVISRLSELAGIRQETPSATFYALIDGLFQRGLIRHLSGDKAAIADMQAGVRSVLSRFVAP